MTRIDAHQHFWRPARGDYGWLRADEPALAPLLREFLPEDLLPLLNAGGIGQTVLVQAAASVAETEFLLELATRHDFIAGVVGWVDLSRADAVATLERLARHPKFKGVRPMLQDLPQADWIASAPHPDAVRALLRLGLRFDALVKPQHLAALLQFVRAWPELPVVIDHAAKPRLAEGWQGERVPDWRRHMNELAALPQVSCKFSGLATELLPMEPTVAALQPVWDALLQWFGPARLLWGSDWPVLTLASSHAQWLEMSKSFIGSLAPSEQDLVWQGSARRFYGLS
ncbi:amidohydrolase family protein [Ramlibacter sp. G-1-2-2]|uniref:Amidohydrolase family protein n=1 Tax=Ramlibacter agri TaxID=2728837 RepID=A0A848H6Z3_9BURK|nr:amidohydrolase family protein [Ramlibacter agri]NML45100.1 amidohydrolase family protein [Ramlibacter agri]